MNHTLKKYRIAAQIVFWSFYGLVMFLVGINFTTSPKLLVFRQALSQLLQKLPENQFFRIHRSYIINLEHIDNIEGNMVRIGEHRLSLSKRKKEAFLEAIQKKGLIG